MADETEKPSELDAQVEYLRGLAQIVAEQGLAKLEIEADDFKMTLKAASFTVSASSAVSAFSAASNQSAPLLAVPFANQTAAQIAAQPTKRDENLTSVVSPMVGVFYRAPSPSDPNFVEVGDRVERGQTIGLVEAMKVFNEITAESAGVVAQIKVETGQLVETGEPLLLLK